METLDLKDIEPLDLKDIQESKTPSKTESALRGLAQGATLGFADELTGGVESALGSLGLVEDKTYEQARDEARIANKLAKEANPKAYLLGELGGGLAGAVVPGVGALGVGKSLGSAVKTGAAMGGLAGLGSSEGDVSTQAADTLKGVALGGAVGAAGKGIEKAIGAYKGSKLRELVQKGVNIDDPVIAQKMAAETSKDLGEAITKVPSKLASEREKMLSQISGRERLVSPATEETIPLIENLKTKYADDSFVRSSLDDIKNIIKKPDLTAEEYRKLGTSLNDLNRLYSPEGKYGPLKDFSSSLKSNLENLLPENMREANQLYSGYLKGFLEPSVLEGAKYSKVGHEKALLASKEKIEELLARVSKGDKTALHELESIKAGLGKFEERSPGLFETISGIKPGDVGQKIEEGSKFFQAIGEYQTPFKATPIDLLATSHNVPLGLAKLAWQNKLGAKAVGKAAQFEKSASDVFQSGLQKVKDYTPEMLTEKAQALMQNESTAKLGQYLLDAVKTNNIAKKNAAMFSALQNPQARAIVMPAKAEQEQE